MATGQNGEGCLDQRNSAAKFDVGLGTADVYSRSAADAITLAPFILVIGVFNFVLGYLLALALADPPLLGLLRSELWRNVRQALLARWTIQPPETPPSASPVDQPNDVPVVATISELPDLWKSALQDDGLKLNTLVTGIAHYLRLEAAIYREHLLTAEGRARQAQAEQEPTTMEQLVRDLRFINAEWSRTLLQAAELIEGRVGRLGPAEESAVELARLLRDQGGQIAEIDRAVHTLEFRVDGSTGCRRMAGEMQQLIQLAYGMRDELQRILAAICRQEGILDQLDRKLHHDVATGFLGRLGLEVLFGAALPAESLPVAAMRISLDRLAKVNQRLGARVGDQAIKAIAQFLAELLAANCENSLIARQAGGDFLILANKATVDELTAIGEHLRQSFEATGFNYQGTEFSVTVSISVAAVAADFGLQELLERLEVVRAEALKAGKNRSARWENGAAMLTLPAAIPVAARIINIETTAA